MNAKERSPQDGNGSFERNDRLTGPLYNTEAHLLDTLCYKTDTNADYARRYIAFVSISSHRDGLCKPIRVLAERLPAAATAVIR